MSMWDSKTWKIIKDPLGLKPKFRGRASEKGMKFPLINETQAASPTKYVDPGWGDLTEDEWKQAAGGQVKGASTVISGGGGSSGSRSSGSPSGNYLDKMIKDSKKAEKEYGREQERRQEEYEEMMEMRKGQYDERYNTLMGWIEEKRPLAQQERATALSGIDAELQNLTTKAGIGKQNIEAQYGETEEELKSQKESLDQDMARIFEGRNIIESSYYIKEKQKSDERFLKTLETLGGEKSRQLGAYDADITYYQKQAVDKRAEIEQAYNETIQAINRDFTKTGWEKEDAIANLESEYQEKINTIDDRIMQYSMQQQEFRASIQQWAAQYDLDFAKSASGYGRKMSTAEKKYQDQLKRENEATGMVRQFMNEYGVDYATAQKMISRMVVSNMKDEKETQESFMSNVRAGMPLDEAIRLYPELSEEEIRSAYPQQNQRWYQKIFEKILE